jgi:hypothetical protein
MLFGAIDQVPLESPVSSQAGRLELHYKNAGVAMLDINPINYHISDLKGRLLSLRGYL